MLTLKTCQADDGTGQIVANYELTFAAPKNGPSIAAPVNLRIHSEGAEATIDLGSASAEAEEAAFEKLAEMLELAAKGLRARGEPKLGVPVYG